jgi:hypothetical protein
MNDANLLEKLINEDLIIPFVAIVGGVIVACTAIVFTCTKSILVSRSREQTKRELAAYIAEGTLDADKAVAILKADTEAEEA